MPDADKTLFQRAFQTLLLVLRRVFLPHLLAGLGLFLVSAYVVQTAVLAPLPKNVAALLSGVVLLVLGGLAFLYALLASGVCAVRQASVSWEEFLDDTLEKIKERAATQIEDLNAGLSKAQARAVLSGSVREVVGVYRGTRSRSLVQGFCAVFLGVLSLALRSVLLARLARAAGKTVQLGKLFSGRATLVGAVFLNLRFFSTVLLYLLYAVGAAVLGMDFLLLYWMR